MKFRQGEIRSLFIVAALFVAAYLLVPLMPEKMASHWGINGQLDGWMPKVPALFLLPGMSLLIFVLFAIVTRFGSDQTAIGDFAAGLDLFINIFLLFIAYVFGLTAAANMNVKFDFIAAMAPAFAGLFYALSLLMEKTKPNRFVGIRTKETLNNPEVWAKVHAKAAELFRYCAILTLAGMLFPKFLLLFMLIPLFVTTVYLAGYAKKVSKKDV